MKLKFVIKSIALLLIVLGLTPLASYATDLPASGNGTVILKEKGVAFDIGYMDKDTSTALKVVESLNDPGEDIFVKLSNGFIYDIKNDKEVGYNEIPSLIYYDSEGISKFIENSNEVDLQVTNVK